MYKVSLKLCSIAIISAIVFLVFSCNNPTKKQKEGTTDSTKTITENPAKKIDDLQKEVFTDTAVSPSKKEIKVEITEDGAKMNDIARLIAGLPADTAKSDLDSFRKSPSWKKFANSFISTWYYALSKRLKPMVKWRNTELDEINKSGDDVFYPFSGPDFMNAFTFFPTAKTYTLLALEKPGGLPVMTQYDTSEIGGYLNSVQKSLKDILILSFFKTISMQKDLDKNSVNGSVPLISIFIVRTGNKILNMERVRISGKGEIVKMSEDTAIKVQNPGIRITFKTSKGEVKELYYFSADISNGGISSNTGMKKYLNSLGDVNSYLKSASYLMHYDNFSFIRNTILAKSKHLLQDDSGIAFKYFETDKWDFQFYGRYKKPIKLFKNREQPDLREAYKKDSIKVRPMPFALGYNFSDKEALNLMLVSRK